jgi:hypothetical protein
LAIDNARKLLPGVDGLGPLETEQLDYADQVMLELPRLAVKALQNAIKFRKMTRSEYDESFNYRFPAA